MRRVGGGLVGCSHDIAIPAPTKPHRYARYGYAPEKVCGVLNSRVGCNMTDLGGNLSAGGNPYEQSFYDSWSSSNCSEPLANTVSRSLVRTKPRVSKPPLLLKPAAGKPSVLTMARAKLPLHPVLHRERPAVPPNHQDKIKAR